MARHLVCKSGTKGCCILLSTIESAAQGTETILSQLQILMIAGKPSWLFLFSHIAVFFLKLFFYPYGEIFLCLQLPKASEFLKWQWHCRSKMTINVPWSWRPVILPCAVAVCRVRAILYIQVFLPPSCKTKGFGCFPKANSLCQLSCTNRKNNQPKQYELLYPRPWVAGHRFSAEVTGKVNSSEHAVFAMPFLCTEKAVPSPSPPYAANHISAL